MERLYGLASELYGLHPWRLIDESQLILVRDSASGEVCYCSVMGMLGEVYSIHAYIGTESLARCRRRCIRLILRGFVNVIDHQQSHRPFSSLQFQPELVLQRVG